MEEKTNNEDSILDPPMQGMVSQRVPRMKREKPLFHRSKCMWPINVYGKRKEGVSYDTYVMMMKRAKDEVKQILGRQKLSTVRINFNSYDNGCYFAVERDGWRSEGEMGWVIGYLTKEMTMSRRFEDIRVVTTA